MNQTLYYSLSSKQVFIQLRRTTFSFLSLLLEVSCKFVICRLFFSTPPSFFSFLPICLYCDVTITCHNLASIPPDFVQHLGNNAFFFLISSHLCIGTYLQSSVNLSLLDCIEGVGRGGSRCLDFVALLRHYIW